MSTPPLQAKTRNSRDASTRGSLVGWVDAEDKMARNVTTPHSSTGIVSPQGSMCSSPPQSLNMSPVLSKQGDDSASQQGSPRNSGPTREASRPVPMSFTGRNGSSCSVVFHQPLKQPAQSLRIKRRPSSGTSPGGTGGEEVLSPGEDRRLSGVGSTIASEGEDDMSSVYSIEVDDTAEITQAEYNNFHRMFTAYDADGSGTIDAEELGHIMQGLGVPMDDEGLHKLLCDALGIEPDRLTGMKSVEIEFPEFVELMAKQKELLMKKGDLSLNEQNSNNKYIKETMQSQHFLVDSPVTWVVDTLMFIAIVYFSLSVPIRFVTTPKAGSSMDDCMLVLEILFQILFVVDVSLKFFTIPANVPDSIDHPLEMPRQEIARMYMTSPMFYVDVLSSLPLELLYSANDDVNLTFRAFKMLKIARVPHLYASSGSLRVMTPNYVSFLYSVVPITNLIFWLAACVHWFSICWLWLGVRAECDDVLAIFDSTGDASANTSQHLILTCRGDQLPMDPTTPLEFLGMTFHSAYLNAIYVVLYTITTVGYGDATVRSEMQKVFACFLFVAGVVINGFVVSKMNRVLSRSDLSSERKAKMVEMVNILRFFDIPNQIQREILSFQHHLLDHNLSSAYSEIIDALPINMQEQLSLYLKLKLVSKVPLFNSGQVHDECKVAIAQSLTNTVAQPNEFIICAGEVGREMCFLGHGVAEVLRPTGQHLATVRKGQFFGEMALVFARDGESKRTASVKALTYCDLYCLFANAFLEILSRFPKFRQVVDKEAYQRRKMQMGMQKHNPLEGRARVSTCSTESEARPVASRSSSSSSDPAERLKPTNSISSVLTDDLCRHSATDGDAVMPVARTNTDPAQWRSSAWSADCPMQPAEAQMNASNASSPVMALEGWQSSPNAEMTSAAAGSSRLALALGIRQTAAQKAAQQAMRGRVNSESDLRKAAGPPPLGELKAMKRKPEGTEQSASPRSARSLFREAAKKAMLQTDTSAVQRATGAARFAGIVKEAVESDRIRRLSSFDAVREAGGGTRDSLNTLQVQLSSLGNQVAKILSLLEHGEDWRVQNTRRSTVFGAAKRPSQFNHQTVGDGMGPVHRTIAGTSQSISRMEFQRIQRSLGNQHDEDNGGGPFQKATTPVSRGRQGLASTMRAVRGSLESLENYEPVDPPPEDDPLGRSQGPGLLDAPTSRD